MYYVAPMDSWENEPKIRPIPIEDDDGTLLPDAGGPRRSSGGRTHRTWMPLAVSAIAVAALVGAVTFFGAVEFDDPPSAGPEAFSLTTVVDQGTEPTEALPPTLAEMIPGVTERLTLVTTDGDAVRTFVWDPTFRVPNEFTMESPNSPEWLSASFDVGGRYIAVNGGEVPTERGTDIWIGPPTEIDPTPPLNAIHSYVWHATDVSRLGYVTSAGDGYVLETVDVDILSKAPSEPVISLSFDRLPNLVRWDNHGIIIQVDDEIVVLDSAGEELWRLDGWAHSASPGYIAQVRMTGSGAQWYLVNRESAETLPFADFGVDAAAELTDVIASPNSDIFAAVTNRGTRSTITVVGPTQSAPRIAQVDNVVYPYTFTADSKFLILKSATSNDLTFVDWRSGATHILDVADGNRVLAVDIG